MNPEQHILAERLKVITRRHFFARCASGIGSLALASLANRSLLAAAPANPLAPKPSHFPARAKRIIFFHMAGGPSQLDLFDYKPALIKLSGQECPESYRKGERFAFIKGIPKLLGTPHAFARHGQCGAELSCMLPHLATVVDDIAIVKSMHTTQFNHAPAQLFMHTGSPLMGRPSMGAWLTYGLGTENQDLPGFVVLASGGKAPDGGSSLWGSGFVPTVYQGVQCRSQGDPVLYVSNPPGFTPADRRRSLDTLNALNRMQLDEIGDPETLTRIEQYELAYRMQTSVPELMEIAKEPPAIHELYGTEPGKASFANNCLLARRLIERGVRFVSLFDWGWDSHGTAKNTDIRSGLQAQCDNTDRACAALVKDLKQRGLLDDTLIVWGGEFGRTPMNEDRHKNPAFIGRDHHPHAFTMWLAGGGIRPGITYGATDEIGYRVVENPVHVHDLQATILHLMGLDHTKLTYRFQGRDFRLTDVAGHVVKELLA
ncbi:MAG: DUF1501 domain-containing protein [Verrucomicrobia bacterium]|nr:DUF1501 domain-containing protein [Verrucomicrobiota bacterium]